MSQGQAQGRFRELELGTVGAAVLGAPPVVRDAIYYLRQGDSHWRRARFEPALRSYSRGLRLDPNRRGAWLGQVRMLVELGEYDEASLWARKALEVFPEVPELYAAWAEAQARFGDLDEARRLSDKSLAGRGASFWVWLARTEVLLADGRTAHAHGLERALAEAAGDWFAFLLAARVYLRHGHKPRAAALAHQARGRAPDEPYTWYVEGDCRHALGERAAARAAYEQALTLDSSFAPARLALAWTRRERFVPRPFSALARRFTWT